MECNFSPLHKILGCLDHYCKVLVVAFVLLGLAAGCSLKGTDVTFVRQETDLGYINKVAILPFSNNSNDDFAAMRIRGITATQVLSMGIFDVIDPGIVDSALREMAIDRNTPIDSPLLKRLGLRLGVQAFIHGSVDDIVVRAQGAFSYPEVSLTMRLLDSETSMVLWQTSAHRNGYSLIDRLFDLNPQDGFGITLELVRDMLGTIPK